MASRRRARQFALMALYASDLGGRPVAASLAGSGSVWDALIEGDGLEDLRVAEAEEIEFAERIANGVDERRAEIDRLIESCSTNWRLPRMPVVDRNILRMGAFELMHCEDIPATVSINEAVELAKRYGTADTKAFVNGIVDRMARTLGRLLLDAPRRKTTVPDEW